MPSRIERRRRAQAGTTLIELLVSLMIIGLVLVFLVGAFSTGILDATLAKRITVANAAQQYELEKIGASTFSSNPTAYSDCFNVDSAVAPSQIASKGSCPAGTSVRADVSETDAQSGVQQWAITVVSYPAQGVVGSLLSVYKVNR
jgi:prepilin-type N-terminal cleavage/methylation domain-containing protein